MASRREDRWDVVDCGFDSPCWVWRMFRTTNGYGQAWGGERLRQAHAIEWERVNGPTPAGKELDHLCRNRACVNPDHLEPVTHRENIRRGRAATKTHCKRGHALEGQNVRVYRGARSCRECKRVLQRERRRAARG